MTTTNPTEEIYDYDDEFPEVCECELDWNCGLHADQFYVPIERIMDAWAKNAFPEEPF